MTGKEHEEERREIAAHFPEMLRVLEDLYEKQTGVRIKIEMTRKKESAG